MRRILMALILAASAPIVTAVPINAPVPTNAYLANFNGLDWAWAAPCPQPNVAGCGGQGLLMIDLSFQSAFGWRLPTATEMATGPTAAMFLFAGANVPAGGTDGLSGATFFGGNVSDGACAAPYFGVIYSHCDFFDGEAGGWAGTPAGDQYGLAEQLVVRRHIDIDVPEPAALALMGFGFLSLRQRRLAAI